MHGNVQTGQGVGCMRVASLGVAGSHLSFSLANRAQVHPCLEKIHLHQRLFFLRVIEHEILAGSLINTKAVPPLPGFFIRAGFELQVGKESVSAESSRFHPRGGVP